MSEVSDAGPEEPAGVREIFPAKFLIDKLSGKLPEGAIELVASCPDNRPERSPESPYFSRLTQRVLAACPQSDDPLMWSYPAMQLDWHSNHKQPESFLLKLMKPSEAPPDREPALSCAQ